MSQKEIKIFIGLREIAGYFSSLKSGFDEIGIKSVFLNLGGNGFKYSAGKNPKWISVLNYIGNHIGSKFSRNFIARFIWLVTFQNLFSFFAFFFATFKYNVFILGSNSTFFYFLELPVLKLFKKKIIYVFLGSDSRPLYLNGYVYKGNRNLGLYILLTKLQKKTIKIIEKYADIVINHPPQAYFNEKPFVSFLNIGFPHKKREFIYASPESLINRPVKIIHIPSKAGPKGSDKFREIISRLKEKYAIDYIEISGISNDEVQKIISTADFALDEFYSDTPLSGFATECAFQGKPAITGSYYAGFICNDYMKSILPPSMFVLPENIEDAIEKLIVDKDFRKQLGENLYYFVSQNWASAVVAEKYLKLIDSTYSKDWLFDPFKIKYLYGCGLSAEQLSYNLKLFIEKGGIKSLCLIDKPSLEKKFLEVIGQTGIQI